MAPMDARARRERARSGPPAQWEHRPMRRPLASDELAETGHTLTWYVARGALVAAIAVEILLLLVALVPNTVWARRGFPNGPIPESLAPLVAGAFYLLPALTGALCRRWQVAVVLATIPAWLDLGAFAVAAATRLGPFYVALDPHAVSTVGTLELFAALGALGWLARTALLATLRRREWELP
jgi:hypothetical protein